MLNVALLFLFAHGIAVDRWRDEGPDADAARGAGGGCGRDALRRASDDDGGGRLHQRTIRSSVRTFKLLAFVAVRRWLEHGPIDLADGRPWSPSSWLSAAKETAVVLPLLFLYYILLIRDDPPAVRRRHLIMLCVPVLAVALVGRRRAARTVRLRRIRRDRRLAVALSRLIELDVFTRYLALMIAPVGQTIFHGVPATHRFSSRARSSRLRQSAMCLALIVLAARRRGIVRFRARLVHR